MREQVVVKELAAGGIWVEGVQASACESCQAKSGCGQQSLKKLGRPVTLWVETSQKFSVGEEVSVELPDGAVAMSALVLYGIPLLGLALGAVIASRFDMPDWQTFLGASAGLAVGFAVARGLSERYQEQWQPRLIPPIDSSSVPGCFSELSDK